MRSFQEGATTNWLGCGAFALTLAACSSQRPVETPRMPTAATLDEFEHPGAYPARSSFTNIAVSREISARCQWPDAPKEAPGFDYDEARLKARGRNILDDVAECLTDGALSRRSVTLVGRADPRGTLEYNLELGESRAEAARDYLINQGVPKTHLVVVSRGEQGARGTNEASWALDRRVDLVLSGR